MVAFAIYPVSLVVMTLCSYSPPHPSELIWIILNMEPTTILEFSGLSFMLVDFALAIALTAFCVWDRIEHNLGKGRCFLSAWNMLKIPYPLG